MLRERRRAANFKPNRRLDRKSSRGMIYENEELRLRTININAEVERGQSDIRKLRRENEQLRREIWSLRDEYDRLDQILRQDKQQHGDGQCATGSSSRHNNKQRVQRGFCGKDDEGEEECEEEEESDEDECSCNRDHCEDCDSGDYCDDDNCNCCGAESGVDATCDTNKEVETAAKAQNEGVAVTVEPPSIGSTRLLNGTSMGSSSSKTREHLHVNFDHLSIVSEENLTGSDGSNSVHNLPTDTVDHHNSLTVPTPLDPAKDGKDPTAESAASHSSRAHLMSLPATPCSPLLTDFQSLVPPLTHFENINYDDIKPLPYSPSTSARRASSSLVSPSACSKFIAKASVKCPSDVTSAIAAPAIEFIPLPSSAADVPPDAPSPEPPDPYTSPSTSPSPSLPPIVASSISSSDWILNNKMVSFSTFRPTIASELQWSQRHANSLETHPFESSQWCEIVPISPKPKHFFAPLKSSRFQSCPTSPDLYVHGVLASPSGSSNSIDLLPGHGTTVAVVEPIYTTTIHKSRPSYPLSITPIGGAIDNPLYGSHMSPTNGCGTGGLTQTIPIAGDSMMDVAQSVAKCSPRSPKAFQVGGNLEELLQDIENMADEVADINLNCVVDGHEEEVDGSNRLVPGPPQSSSDLTPPPNLPEPMSLLPATLPYLDFRSNTAVITTPKAAVANRSAAAQVQNEKAVAATAVTSVVSKPICSATAVRKKLFGKKNKDTVIDEPEHDWRAPVIPLKITIPSMMTGSKTITDDRASGPQAQAKITSFAVAAKVEEEAESSTSAIGNHKQKSRRVSLSFPNFGGSKKSVPEDEKDTSSLENLDASIFPNSSNGNLQSQGKKPALHRVSSGADVSSISTSIGSPSTPIKGQCHHHRHNSQKKGKGRSGHSRTSSESQNVYSSAIQGHHHCDMERRNSTMNDAMTTSMSERNSNSLASSRESSTSLSMRSQKSRRISENSHSNGKIPWCGCWGNGCL